MTRSQLAKRTATFMVVVVAGFFLGTYLDQRFTAPDDSEPGITWNDSSRERNSGASWVTGQNATSSSPTTDRILGVSQSTNGFSKVRIGLDSTTIEANSIANSPLIFDRICQVR